MIDRYSETWATIEAWAQKELQDERTSLETHGRSLEQTEYLRGRISALRALLALIEKPAIPPNAFPR